MYNPNNKLYTIGIISKTNYALVAPSHQVVTSDPSLTIGFTGCVV